MATLAQLGKTERFRSYNRWLQEKFGERVYKVIVDAGFTCPNRDGTVAVGGCGYCNNNSFRPPSAIKTDPIRDQVRDGIEYIRKRFDARKFIIYFQPFSNTYAETEYLRRLYTEALDHAEVVGLAIGTRPDRRAQDSSSAHRPRNGAGSGVYAPAVSGVGV